MNPLGAFSDPREPGLPNFGVSANGITGYGLHLQG